MSERQSRNHTDTWNACYFVSLCQAAHLFVEFGLLSANVLIDRMSDGASQQLAKDPDTAVESAQPSDTTDLSRVKRPQDSPSQPPASYPAGSCVIATDVIDVDFVQPVYADVPMFIRRWVGWP